MRRHCQGRHGVVLGHPDPTLSTKLRIGVGEVTGSFATGAAIEIADSGGTPINLGSNSAIYPLVAAVTHWYG